MQEPTIEQQAKLYMALGKAQQEVDGASKSRMGQVGQQKYKYADLASVEEAIGTAPYNNGLAVVQIPGRYENGSQELLTIIAHSEGGFIHQMMSVPCQNTAQAAGSAITYMRRYALLAIFRILAEDDDGHTATNGPRPSNRAPQNQPDMGTPTTAFTPVIFPNEPRQPSLSSLTGNQIRALVSNTKFPSSGIVGAYLKNDGALGPIVDAQVEAWSSDNEGADGMALLRAAAAYAATNLEGEIAKRAKAWLTESQS